MATDRSFPGPYRNSVPQNLDNPDPMITRVPASYTDVGARKGFLPPIRNEHRISHVPNQNNK